LFGEVTGDLMGTLGVAKEIPVIGSMISPFLPDENEEQGTDGTEGKDGSIVDDVTDAITDVMKRVAPRTLPRDAQQYVDPRSQIPGIILDEKHLGGGRTQYTYFDHNKFLDVVAPHARLWGKGMSTYYKSLYGLFADEP
jgi:hypothetical protein